MKKIATLNKISPIGLDKFDRSEYSIGESLDNADAILVRSASLHDTEFPDSLKAIARAGAGVNNIPVDDCAKKGIVVFNTPGANANAVKELVVAGMLLASRKIVPAIDWAKTLKGNGDEVGKMVEKGKSAFAGPEIQGKTLGVIGLGAIGILVANAARSLGMEVYGYDPYLSVDAAWSLSRSIKHAKTLNEIYANCDYITIHVPLNEETKEMVCEESIATMKDGVRILNFARGGLVDDNAIIASLETGKVSAYVTDFPTDALIGVNGVIAIPHLGASTPESEDNCAAMAAKEVIAFLEYGSIKNSVNMPNVELDKPTHYRVCVIHQNIPNMLTQISGLVSKAGINIENMVNKSRKDYAYTVLDMESEVPTEVMAQLADIEGVIRAWKVR
jgi:D-3-phosphoglycerate dehydrogenase